MLLSQHSKSKHHEVSFSGSLMVKLSAVNRIIGVRFTSGEPCFCSRRLKEGHHPFKVRMRYRDPPGVPSFKKDLIWKKFGKKQVWIFYK